MAEYQSKLRTTSIKFSSRSSVKINDNFFTIEACEERFAPEYVEDINWEEERKLLWDCVNDECDRQIADIIKFFKDKKL